MRAFSLALAFGLSLAATLAPSVSSGASLAHVSGTVAYRERIALPPSATVTVSIDEAAVGGVPARTIAETTFQPNRQVPIPFHLSYSKFALDPGRDYVVRASISIDGQLRFTTNTTYPVITKGHPSHADIMLVGTTSANGGSASLGSTAWKLESLEGHSLAGISQDRLPYIQFDTQAHEVSGFSGCNRIFGGYTSDGASLHLNTMGMTMMACPETALSEQTFTAALQTVNSYAIEGGKLKLFRDGALVATFSPYTPPGH